MSLQVNQNRTQKAEEIYLIINLNYGYPVSAWTKREKAIQECEELTREGEYMYEVRPCLLNVKGGAVQ
jgi:hypothetical protein